MPIGAFATITVFLGPEDHTHYFFLEETNEFEIPPEIIVQSRSRVWKLC